MKSLNKENETLQKYQLHRILCGLKQHEIVCRDKETEQVQHHCEELALLPKNSPRYTQLLLRLAQSTESFFHYLETEERFRSWKGCYVDEAHRHLIEDSRKFWGLGHSANSLSFLGLSRLRRLTRWLRAMQIPDLEAALVRHVPSHLHPRVILNGEDPRKRKGAEDQVIRVMDTLINLLRFHHAGLVTVPFEQAQGLNLPKGRYVTAVEIEGLVQELEQQRKQTIEDFIRRQSGLHNQFHEDRISGSLHRSWAAGWRWCQRTIFSLLNWQAKPKLRGQKNCGPLKEPTQ